MGFRDRARAAAASFPPLLTGSFTRPWPLYVLGIQIANVAGAAFVFGFLQYLLPGDDAIRIGDEVEFDQIKAFLGYLAMTGFLASGVAWLLARPVIVWQAAPQTGANGHAARNRALRIPLLLAWALAAFWTIGGIIFVVSTADSVQFAVITSLTVAIGAGTACAIGYLFAERVLRPVHADAIASGDASLRKPPSVSSRLRVGWSVTVLVPVSGIVVVAAAALTGSLRSSAEAVLSSILILSAGLLVGSFAVTKLTAGAISDPINQLRAALKRVQAGDYSTPVHIYDATELGQLQAGFNEMVTAIEEREELRDLFGRYVGIDVARRALRDGVALGGEERFVAVLFVDLTGSTNLAMQQPPAKIVTLLNNFFHEVVEAVDRHDGLVNKFLGDAAMAVFGAPLEHSDPAGAALAAARELAQRLPYILRTDPGGAAVGFGIGVAAGSTVAGNVGAAHRLEYTVIGDPVNEAARITELAKDEPGCVLASGTSVSRAHPDEAQRWQIVRSEVLRGRGVPTPVAAPTATLKQS
ncbi:adenylate/guanylate cyclase domain-containing protein [Hoyosella subflava]|uniref:Adenylate cyclase, family protein 3 n=1 Tax=Hoyosella subflava (strain DSM 45089 / JCM 17490 / NBRC 109087 / DQS3-9A1) TaxID=443218 RepID=F6EG52_HOYSD|nr:adenylate/guanylate cyclase domain-containing protein [Hoyosella subflava]AEF38754.1 Adenylate cyclase, family protein 3 [Hoyosella subflava DQS3-9A1]